MRGNYGRKDPGADELWIVLAAIGAVTALFILGPPRLDPILDNLESKGSPQVMAFDQGLVKPIAGTLHP